MNYQLDIMNERCLRCYWDSVCSIVILYYNIMIKRRIFLRWDILCFNLFRGKKSDTDTLFIYEKRSTARQERHWNVDFVTSLITETRVILNDEPCVCLCDYMGAWTPQKANKKWQTKCCWAWKSFHVKVFPISRFFFAVCVR